MRQVSLPYYLCYKQLFLSLYGNQAKKVAWHVKEKPKLALTELLL